MYYAGALQTMTFVFNTGNNHATGSKPHRVALGLSGKANQTRQSRRVRETRLYHECTTQVRCKTSRLFVTRATNHTSGSSKRLRASEWQSQTDRTILPTEMHRKHGAAFRLQMKQHDACLPFQHGCFFCFCPWRNGAPQIDPWGGGGTIVHPSP